MQLQDQLSFPMRAGMWSVAGDFAAGRAEQRARKRPGTKRCGAAVFGDEEPSVPDTGWGLITPDTEDEAYAATRPILSSDRGANWTGRG